jgi:hypothetical protein
LQISRDLVAGSISLADQHRIAANVKPVAAAEVSSGAEARAARQECLTKLKEA